MRTVTAVTNNPGLKYTLIGTTSDGVHFYKEEVNTEFYKHRELLQENIDNKQKEIIKKQVEYKLPEVIKEDTFFNRDYTYDVSVDVKYKNIKVTNESTGDVKVFETFGIPRRVMLNKNALTYDDFIDETSSYYNYIVDINTEAVIGKRSIESSHSGDSSIDFPSLDFNLPVITPIAFNLLPQYAAARYRVNINGALYNGQNTFFPLISSETSLSNFNILRANYTNFEGKSPATINYNDDVYLRTVNVGNINNLKDSFISSPLSSIAPTSTNISRNYEPSNSAWSVDYSEGYVMDTRISSVSLTDSSKNWELRVGKGGQIYSLKTDALGETIPPQYRSSDGGQWAPWVDEVWQSISVDTSGAVNNFAHGSGIYLKDPILTAPYYCPRLATEIDQADRSVYYINWNQPSASSSTYTLGQKSYILNLSKYKDLGDGIIEVTTGLYNFGPDTPDFHTMPWGGVRRTALEYSFMANTDQSTYTQSTNYFGGGATYLADTGGWNVYTSTTAGDTQALGLVFGNYADDIPGARSAIRDGYAGGTPTGNETDWRNYFVTENIKFYDLESRKGMWASYYFVIGDNKDDVRTKVLSNDLVNSTTFELMSNSEASSSLMGYKLSLDGSNFSIDKSSEPDFYVYEQLIDNSVPLFEIIKNDGSKYVTWDPYTSGTTKMYDGTVQAINLLGFALRTADATGPYTYDTLDNIFASYSSYYNAGGESLSVRV